MSAEAGSEIGKQRVTDREKYKGKVKDGEKRIQQREEGTESRRSATNRKYDI